MSSSSFLRHNPSSPVNSCMLFRGFMVFSLQSQLSFTPHADIPQWTFRRGEEK